MHKLKIFLPILFVVFLTSCISEWDKNLETKTLDYEITDCSEYFDSKTFNFNITQYQNELSVEMKVNLPYDFDFPFDSSKTKKLVNTTFYYDFMLNGKPIRTEKYLLNQYEHSLIKKDGTISFRSKLKNINVKSKFKIDIPLYIFHNLKSGKQKIELDIYQKHFQNTKEYNNKTGYYDSILTVYEKKLWGKIEFEFNMPKIYLTKIFTDSIILRDDETFSPQGMDFSFRNGYPDIYWELYFPLKAGKRTRYFKSAEANYATAYTEKDTVHLYHYGKNKDIKIGVYDRDDLSNDDIIGIWKGEISDIRKENDEYTKLKFDNIASFRIKANKKDIPVN